MTSSTSKFDKELLQYIRELAFTKMALVNNDTTLNIDDEAVKISGV